MKPALLLLCVSVLAPAQVVHTAFNTGAAACGNGFSFCRLLTTDHTQTGTADSTNYPLGIHLSNATFKDTGHGGHVQSSSGADVEFFSDSACSTQIASEIEFYDNVNGIVWAFAKLATLSHSSDTSVYVCYGDASPPARTTNPWNANFHGVWHFPNGTTLGLNDSTTNANNLTGQNTPTATTGIFDGGIGLVAASSQSAGITSSVPASLIPGTGAWSIEAWVNTSSSADMYANGNDIATTNHDGYSLEKFTDNHPRFIYGDDTHDVNIAGSGTINDGAWHYMVGEYDGSSTVTLYTDGVSVASTSFTTGAFTTMPAFYVGRRDTWWDGSLDEIRASATALSTSWITATYNNLKTGSTFVTVGPEL